MKAFWNDKQGLSLSEWVAVVVISVWAIVTLWMAGYMFHGELTDKMVNFYSVLGWMPLGVIGGLFGEKAVERLGRRASPVPGNALNINEGSAQDETWSQGNQSC